MASIHPVCNLFGRANYTMRQTQTELAKISQKSSLTCRQWNEVKAFQKKTWAPLNTQSPLCPWKMAPAFQGKESNYTKHTWPLCTVAQTQKYKHMEKVVSFCYWKNKSFSDRFCSKIPSSGLLSWIFLSEGQFTTILMPDIIQTID